MKKEELKKAQESESKLTSSHYYDVEAVMAAGTSGVLGYYVYQSKKGSATSVTPVN